VTRGQLPQRAGSLGLKGGGTAAAVPPVTGYDKDTGQQVPELTEAGSQCWRIDHLLRNLEMKRENDQNPPQGRLSEARIS